MRIGAIGQLIYDRIVPALGLWLEARWARKLRQAGQLNPELARKQPGSHHVGFLSRALATESGVAESRPPGTSSIEDAALFAARNLQPTILNSRVQPG